MHTSWLSFLPYHTDIGTPHSMYSLPLLMSVFIMAHIPLQSLARTNLCNLLYQGITQCSSLFIFSGGTSVSTWTFLGSWLTPCHEIILPEGNAGTDKDTFILVKLWICSLHTQSTFSNVSLWFLPYSSKPTIKMSSAIRNMLDMPLNNSLIFFLNGSPAEAVPNGSHI